MKNATTFLLFLALWGITGLSTALAQNCVTPTMFSSNSTTVGSATITWNQPPNVVDYELRYRVIGSGVVPTYVTTTTPSITLNNLLPNTCYEYSMRSRCGNNNQGPWSPVQNFCVIGGPNGFCAPPSNINTVPGINTASINWVGSPNVLGYEIRYREVGTSALSYVSPTNTSTVLTGLISNTCYEFSVRTVCGSSNVSNWVRGSNFCTAASPSCVAPSNITTVPSSTTAAINWTGSNNVLGYEIRYREVGTSALSYVSPSGPNTTLTGLTPNTCYEFSVRTLCDTNDISDWVRGADFCTPVGQPCLVPSNITTAPTTLQTNVTWAAQANALNYELRYRIIGSGVVPTYVYPTTNMVSLNNLVPGSCYEFTLRTRCDSTTFSPWSSIQNFCVPDSSLIGCTEPTNITTVPNSTTAAINWTGSNNVLGYEIRYREVGTSALSYVSPSSPNTILTGLTPNTCYEFSVRALCDSNDASAWVRGTNFCTTVRQPCVAPSNITTVPSSTTAAINWTGSNNVFGYEIRYREVGTSTLSYVSTNSSNTTLTGLMPNTCYEFSIRTVCDSNDLSAWVRGPNFCTNSSGNLIDTIPPVAVCQPITVYLDNSGLAIVTPDMIDGGSSDNSGITNLLINGLSSVNFSCNNLGIQQVTLSATDSTGNLGRCVTTITVIDTIAPIVSCGTHTAILSPNGTVTVAPTDVIGNASDNCGSIQFSINGMPAMQFNCNDLGVHPVTISATDASGNVNTCIANINVIDTIAPIINCVAFQNVYLNPNGVAVVHANDAINNATDNCGGVQLTINGSSTQTYTAANIGRNLATITAADNSGNTASCIATINVLDSNNVACDSIRFVSVDSVTMTTANLSWQQSGSSGQYYQVRYGVVGAPLTITVVNASGPVAFLNNLTPSTCYHFDVRVVCDSTALNFGPWSNQMTFCTDSNNVDRIPPVALCRDTTVFLSPNGTVTITSSTIDNGSFDNVGITNYLVNGSNAMPFFCNNLGINPVQLIVQDSAGNSATCVATVNVIDPMIPVAQCSGQQTVYLDPNGVAIVTGSSINAGSFDNCGISQLLINGSDSVQYTQANIGANTVTLQVSDATGNSDTCMTTIVVLDSINNSVVCDSIRFVSVDSVTMTTANLSWQQSGSSGQYYQVRYGVVGAPLTITVVNASGPVAFLNNLTPSTCYHFDVRVVCDSTALNFGPWSNQMTFCTDSISNIPCTSVSNFTIDSIGNTFAFFTWDSMSNAQNYTLRYRPLNAIGAPAGPYEYLSTPFNNGGLFQLNPSICYEVEIQTYCVNGDSSIWSNNQIFCTGMTSFQCNRPTSTTGFATTDSSSQTSQINLFWNSTNATNGYDVRFRPIGGASYNFRHSNDTTALVRQLQPGTCYEYNVRSICDSSISGLLTYSFWSVTDTVCTPFNNLNPTNPDAQHTFQQFGTPTLSGELFPNPTNGQVTVRFNQALKTRDYQVRLFNALGVEIVPNILRRNVNGFEAQLSNLPTGLYLLQITSDKQRWTTRVQVSK